MLWEDVFMPACSNRVYLALLCHATLTEDLLVLILSWLFLMASCLCCRKHVECSRGNPEGACVHSSRLSQCGARQYPI